MAYYKPKFNVGDIVTTYYAGYYRITGFDGTRKKTGSGLVSFKKVMDSDFIIYDSAVDINCDQSYCELVDVNKMKKDFLHNMKKLRKIIKEGK